MRPSVLSDGGNLNILKDASAVLLVLQEKNIPAILSNRLCNTTNLSVFFTSIENRYVGADSVSTSSLPAERIKLLD